jgi:hypothetical protein
MGGRSRAATLAIVASLSAITGARPARAGGKIVHAARQPSAPPEQKTPFQDYFEMLVDDGYFLPPLADVEAPLNSMRFYLADPVSHTTAPPGYPTTGKHLFWDVSFGEEFFVVSLHNPDADGRPPSSLVRWPTGVSLFIDADMHMLLDFAADSSPVIDSEFHLGGGFMGRGLPWLTRPGAFASHFSWKAKFFHESTHIGDEYLDDVRKAQKAAADMGAAPITGFVHPNVSYLAAELLLAVDGEVGPAARCVDVNRPNERGPRVDPYAPPPDARSCSGFPLRPAIYWRAYVGARRLFSGPYDLDSTPSPFGDIPITHEGSRNEGQAGAELRWRLTALDDVTFRAPDYLIFGADTRLRRQYDYDGTNASPRWASFNVLAGVEWGDWADSQMVFRAYASYYDGINPHGQFRNELLRYGGVTLQFDY